MNDENNDQIEDFLKKFKVVMNNGYGMDIPFDQQFDIVVLFENKPVLRTKWGCGIGIDPIYGADVLQTLFQEAESYSHFSSFTPEDALPEFLEELGYLENAKSVKQGIKAFWKCKRFWEILNPLVLNNAAWHDNDKHDEEYLWDIMDFMDNIQGARRKLVDVDYHACVSDYMKEEL